MTVKSITTYLICAATMISVNESASAADNTDKKPLPNHQRIQEKLERARTQCPDERFSEYLEKQTSSTAGNMHGSRDLPEKQRQQLEESKNPKLNNGACELRGVLEAYHSFLNK
jgi:hypothetical protein